MLAKVALLVGFALVNAVCNELNAGLLTAPELFRSMFTSVTAAAVVLGALVVHDDLSALVLVE